MMADLSDNQRRKKPVVAAVAIGAAILFSSDQSAFAYDDNDCQRQETVTISVDEDVKNWAEMDVARTRALDHTAERAIKQVIGYRLESSDESKTELNNGDADQRFKQLEKRQYSGLVRIKVDEESRKVATSGATLALRSVVTVCVPKPDYLLKAERERAERERKPAQQVDPTKTAWFDPVTGEPRVWYWRDGRTFEFFDNSGFHPRTGEKLTPIDRKLLAEWQAAIQRERKEAVEKVLREQRAAVERAQREQREAEDRAQRERAQREAEVQRQAKIARAAGTCDRSAAGLYDQDRPKDIVGASFDTLRANAQEAVEACELAAQQFPDERRFRYQLARAIQATDPKRAIPVLQALMRQNYRAAFDNYGWAMLDTRVGRNDLDGAIASFKRGAQLGDPDAMMSLATMMMKGRVEGQSTDDAVKLLRRAAALGHQDAASTLESLVASQRQAEVQRQQNEQAARAFIGLMGGALGGIGRR